MAKIGRISGGVKYSKSVTKSVSRWKIDSDLINESALTKQTRKEIQRVFHAANRRLENISNSGVFSPAANAIMAYLDDTDGGDVSRFNKFAKFSTAGKDFDTLKRDYAAAIEFLRKPTSTASGAKQFEQEVRKQTGLSEDAFNHIKSMITDGQVNEFGNVAALIPSDPTKVLDAFKTAEKSLADEIENAATNINALKQALKSDIEEQAKAGFPQDLRPLFDAFDNFE